MLNDHMVVYIIHDIYTGTLAVWGTCTKLYYAVSLRTMHSVLIKDKSKH